MINPTPKQHLTQLRDALIEGLLQRSSQISEGKVMTVGPPPYRRIDARGRALAYIRVRPRKLAVRIDMSGLWLTPAPSPLQIPSTSGATLLLRELKDVEPAIEFLVDAMKSTFDAEYRYEIRRREAAA